MEMNSSGRLAASILGVTLLLWSVTLVGSLVYGVGWVAALSFVEISSCLIAVPRVLETLDRQRMKKDTTPLEQKPESADLPRKAA